MMGMMSWMMGFVAMWMMMSGFWGFVPFGAAPQ